MKAGQSFSNFRVQKVDQGHIAKGVGLARNLDQSHVGGERIGQVGRTALVGVIVAGGGLNILGGVEHDCPPNQFYNFGIGGTFIPFGRKATTIEHGQGQFEPKEPVGAIRFVHRSTERQRREKVGLGNPHRHQSRGQPAFCCPKVWTIAQ